ncbi:hypothetical protein QFC21_001052 [Naganishia friedmannii]|uniref:Uncharacterized protein n=1 Tax=Naganishia friedmannii TaxID=89922 RepID=A0ACC2W815_9TREE|nr:hypothetical protein QFC21_001052 [Naganishia friedmannii]
MSSQTNEGVFFLEDVGSPPGAPSRTLTSSPVQASSITPTETANSSPGSSPTASPHRSVMEMPSVGQAQPIGTTTKSGTPSTYLVPPAAPTKLPSNATSSMLGTSPLSTLHKRPIHATPPAPSPLARASIVPHSNSDSDGASNDDSAFLSDDDDDEVEQDEGGRSISARMRIEENSRIAANSGGSKSAAGGKFTLGSPQHRGFAERAGLERNTTELAHEESLGTMMTPESLLRAKRSDSGSSQGALAAISSSSINAVPVPAGGREYNSATISHLPVYEGSPLSYQSYPRQRSESFGASMDPLLPMTIGNRVPRKRSDSIGSAGALSTGGDVGPSTGSALGFSASIPEKRRTIDKGKAREVWPVETTMASASFGTSVGTLSSSASSKLSPRRERERGGLRASASLSGDSPIKSRRMSEFSHSGSEGRRLSISSSGGLSRSLAPILPQAISNISPLNPLPSPWRNTTGNNASVSGDSPTSSSGAIRLNRVPTSVRLAADVLKSTPGTPSSDSSMIMSPLSGSLSRQTSIAIRKQLDSELVVTIPSTPVATRNPTPEEIPIEGDEPRNLPALPPALTSPPDPVSSDTSPMKSGSFKFAKPASRVRASLPPPSAFTPLHDALLESPPLPTEFTVNAGPSRTSWQGPVSSAGMPALGVLGKGITVGPRDRSRSTAETFANVASSIGLGINMSTSYGGKLSSTAPFLGSQGHARTDSERSIDSTSQGWTDNEGDAARHANLILQTRRAKIQKWRPGSAERETKGFGPLTTSVGPRLGRTISSSVLDFSRQAVSVAASDRLSAWTFDQDFSSPLLSNNATPLFTNATYPSISPGKLNPDGSPALSSSAHERTVEMDKQHSADSTVNDIEWVDWLDEYRSYKHKEAQMRAEGGNVLQLVHSEADTPITTNPSHSESLAPSSISTVAGAVDTGNSSSSSPLLATQRISENVAALDLTPRQQHIAKMHNPLGIKLSRTISHSSELLTRTASRIEGKRIPSNPFSSSSQGVARQVLHPNKGSLKKGKALGNKIEGWWLSVKTNFQHQATGGSPVPPRTLPFPPRGLPPRQSGEQARTKTPINKAPSAPSSRRGSVMPSISDVPPAMPTFDNALERQSHALRTATSHTDLARLNEGISTVGLGSPLSVGPSPTFAEATPTFRQLSDPLIPTATSNLARPFIPVQRAATGLEARRKQPALSLKLDQSILKVPPHQQRQYSESSTAASGSGVSSGTGSQGLAIGSRHESAYGLTPGVHGWDQTPSPLQALNARTVQSPPLADVAEFNRISVQRHVRHRLGVAKESCDKDLQAIITEITAFVEQHLQQERQAVTEVPFEDEENTERLDELSRPFGSMSSVGSANAALEMDTETLEQGSTQLSRGEFERPWSPDHVFTDHTAPTPKAPSLTIPRTVRSRQGSISLATSPLKRREMPLATIRSDPTSPGRRKSVAIGGRTVRAMDINSRFGRALELGAEPDSLSRSTSRSRSPMPPFRRLFTDESHDDSLVDGLQKIIAIATDVLEMNVSSLLSRPAECRAKVGDVVALGELWNQHPDWPGKEWFYQLLLAVAGLSRVVEWWETEKGFWNWDDEDDIGQFTFIMKPIRENDSQQSTPFMQPKVFHEGGSNAGTPSIPAARPGSTIDSEMLLPPAMSVDGLDTARTVMEAHKRFESIEDLQLQAERAKSVNIVMELSLDGDTIEWINPAWQEVLGTDPMENDTPSLSAWLAPADVDVLSNASRQLEDDDTHTAQARFRLLHTELSDAESDGSREPGPTYLEFEGIGMLMRDRDTGSPTHTMWVIKPVISSQVDQDTLSDSTSKDEPEEALAIPLSTNGVLSSQTLLCRICERQVPTWFFEKHNETCNEVHRLEADITNVNERLLELRKSVQETRKNLDKPGCPASYQGIIITPKPRNEPDYRHGQVALAVQKIHQTFLEQAYNILTQAYQISTPSIREESANTPIRYQTLLSPTSEERLSKIGRWQKPNTDQAALQLLFQDVDEVIRAKQRSVNRMRNTIVYSERVRQEWEDRIDRMLSIAEETSDGSLSPKEEVQDQGEEMHDADSTPSSKDKARAIDPHARLPVTLGRIPSHHHSPGEGTVDVACETAISSPGVPNVDTQLALQNVQQRKGSGRRASGAKTPSEAPMSPRLPPVAPARKQATSIKDFDIIKPISRGAFGSVYLAKKRTTGDYYAIKALRKQDMIAKNQITNVKAERTILMNQANSPYVAKLFWSFQSREYLYLVMEYLNGGDCAALIRTLGGLPEEWVKCYIAEVVLGLDYMHDRGIVHRDIKPDNLLIDSKGHLKLTDFGLSRAGLLNRQMGSARPTGPRTHSAKRPRGSHRTVSRRTESPSILPSTDDSLVSTPDVALPPTFGAMHQSYFSNHLTEGGSADESSGSEGISAQFDHGHSARGNDKAAVEARKFVGTPDYLCPESILGFGTDDAAVDWWALGVVMYEFLFGFPPFHDETPDKVFENIIARRINWYEDQIEVSPEARDLMERLMCTDPQKRLGAQGAAEVKRHPFFAEIDWATIATIEANFVPNVTDPESTDYFDARGALPQVFTEDDEEPNPSSGNTRSLPQGGLGRMDTLSAPGEIGPSNSTEDFGNFHYKNVHVLKEANDEQVRKLRKDSALQSETMMQGQIKDRRLSLAIGKRKAKHRLSMGDNMPPSPSTSTSSSASTPGIPQTPSCILSPNPRRPSENRLNKVRAMHDWDDTVARRSSAPEPMRPPSASEEAATDPPTTASAPSVSRQRAQSAQIGLGHATNASNSPLSDSRKVSDGHVPPSHSRAVDVLIAEDNPISQKICETLLTRMGCRCVCVNDGAEALAATMGTIQFDVIICDLVMPNVSGEEVARMIRSTNNPNVNTPIIAATSYEHKQISTVTAEAQREQTGAIFNAILAKPITKRDLTDCLAKLGFITGNGNAAVGGGGGPPRGSYSRTASGKSLSEPVGAEPLAPLAPATSTATTTTEDENVQQSSSDETMRPAAPAGGGNAALPPVDERNPEVI